MIRTFIRKFVSPFDSTELLPGQLFSNLDVRADGMGIGIVEELFSNRPPLQRLLNSLERLLGDKSRAVLALKKNLHRIVEERLRILALTFDPPQNYGFGISLASAQPHPIDWELAGKIGVDAAKPNFRVRWWHLAELLSVSGGMIARAFVIGVRFGRLNVEPIQCRFLALNATIENRWLAISEALKVRAGYRQGDFVAEVGIASGRKFLQIPTVDPDKLPVAIWPWIRDAILPSVLLAGRALATGLRQAGDPIVVESAIQTLRLANRALDARRLVSAVRFEYCADQMEINPRHILLGALAESGKIVRWPLSDMDGPGIGLSYLGYDVFLASGNYQYDSYRRTWLASTQAASVGMMQHDRRIHSDIDETTSVMRRIEEHLAAGRKMAVVFGPSDLQSLWAPFAVLLTTALGAFKDRSDWFVVIKPKLTDTMYDRLRDHEALNEWAESPNVIAISYDPPGKEVCPSGYLIRQMNLAIGMTGTATFESLVQNKPYFVYYPVVYDTTRVRKLRDAGLWHESAVSLSDALDRFVADPNSLSVPYDWFRHASDPYGDDRAIDRIVETLYPDAIAASQDAL